MSALNLQPAVFLHLDEALHDLLFSRPIDMPGGEAPHIGKIDECPIGEGAAPVEDDGSRTGGS